MAYTKAEAFDELLSYIYYLRMSKGALGLKIVEIENRLAIEFSRSFTEDKDERINT